MNIDISQRVFRVPAFQLIPHALNSSFCCSNRYSRSLDNSFALFVVLGIDLRPLFFSFRRVFYHELRGKGFLGNNADCAIDMIVLISTVITRNLSGRQDDFSNIIYCQVIDTRILFYGCNVISAYLIPDRCKVTSCSRIILFHRPGRSCASIWPRSDIVCQDLAVSCYNVLVRNCTVIISVAIRPSSTCRTDFCFQITFIGFRCPLACVIVHRVASRQFQEVDISTATVRIFKLSYIDGKLLIIRVLLIVVINIVSVFEFCRTYRLTFNCRILNIFLRGERYHIIARLYRPTMVIGIPVWFIGVSA